MDMFEELLRERQQMLELAESTMSEVQGDALAEGVSALLGPDAGPDYDEFVAELHKQSGKRFLVGRFQKRGYYALDPDSQKGFWIAEWSDGDIQGRGRIKASAAESLMQAAKRRGLA